MARLYRQATECPRSAPSGQAEGTTRAIISAAGPSTTGSAGVAGEVFAVSGDLGSYLYWSDRLVHAVADDNGINLEDRISWKLSLPLGLGSIDLGSKEKKAQAAGGLQ